MKTLLRCYIALAILLAPLMGAQAGIAHTVQESIDVASQAIVTHDLTLDCHEAVTEVHQDQHHKACDASKHLCCLASLYISDSRVSLVNHFTQRLEDQFRKWSLKTFLEPIEHPPKALS